jgi:hypothetical protein
MTRPDRVCRCGHARLRHGLRLGMPGRGPCVLCSCQRFVGPGLRHGYTAPSLLLLTLVLAACDHAGGQQTFVQACERHTQSDGSTITVCVGETPPP